jgi:hypothetical protein
MLGKSANILHTTSLPTCPRAAMPVGNMLAVPVTLDRLPKDVVAEAAEDIVTSALALPSAVPRAVVPTTVDT